MKANWVFSATYSPDPTIDLGVVKNIGSTWGSWKSWRACQTDNVICNSKKEIEALLSKSFQNSCNFTYQKSFIKSLVNLQESEHTKASLMNQLWTLKMLLQCIWLQMIQI